MKVAGRSFTSSSGSRIFDGRLDHECRDHDRADRLAEIIEVALAQCGGGGPIVMGSCNGGARRGTKLVADELRARSRADRECRVRFRHARALPRPPDDRERRPRGRVVAADRITTPSRSNFEALRVLSETPAPVSTRADGFRLAGAAVALHLTRSTAGPFLHGPVLGQDLDGDDALDRVLAALAPRAPELVIGQGAGPAANDELELAAIARHVAHDVPLATALYKVGHTLGASSLLSVALAVQARTGAGRRTPVAGSLRARRPAARRATIATDHRDLSRARRRVWCVQHRRRRTACRPPCAWGLSAPPPLRDPVLRGLATTAAAERPAIAPDLLVVTLDAPLPPAARGRTRILPSSVLEMTPGFTAQLVARAWGFRGPALCLVGGEPAPLLATCRSSHERVYRIAIRGMEARDVEWDA